MSARPDAAAPAPRTALTSTKAGWLAALGLLSAFVGGASILVGSPHPVRAAPEGAGAERDVVVGAPNPAAGFSAGGLHAVDDEVVIEIRAEGLSQRAVAILPGGTVRWVNRDVVAHNTTHLPPAGEPSRWNSYELMPGRSFTQTLSLPGSYRYFDFFDPDDPDFHGVVIVTTDEMPNTPTPWPTSTQGATPTQPPPTPTRTVTPTASPAAEVFRGTLSAYGGPCLADASLTLCATGSNIPLVAGYDLSAYYGLDVEVQGVEATCPQNGSTVILISAIRTIPGGCNAGTPTPEPTPTPADTGNLARGRVTRASVESPGHQAGMMTDGSTQTYWEAIGDTAWVYVDLGTEMTFNQVMLDWGPAPATRYGLYSWNAARGEWAAMYWNDAGLGGHETISVPAVYARYVLVYAVGTNTPRTYSIREMEVHGRERPNFALGAAVVASSDQECCPAWYAVDGDFRTGWASERGQPNPWLQVHLPSATDVTEVRLYWDHFAYPTAYSLVFYNGGEQPRQLIVPSAPPGLNRFEFSWPMRADTILVYAHYLTPLGFVALSETELYGPPLVNLIGQPPSRARRLGAEPSGPAARPAPAKGPPKAVMIEPDGSRVPLSWSEAALELPADRESAPADRESALADRESALADRDSDLIGTSVGPGRPVAAPNVVPAP